MTHGEARARFHAEEIVRSSADALGEYWIGQATIRLSDWIHVFRDDGSFDPDSRSTHVAVFLHEYLHYLHNCSTLVGIEQSVAAIVRATLFGRTLTDAHDGRSRGHA